MSKQGQAPILTEQEQKQVLKGLDKSAYKARDKAIFLLSFKSGLRAKEIAEVCLGDFVNQVKPISAKPISSSAKTIQSDFYVDADLKKTVTLRRNVTKGSKVEKCHIVSKDLRSAILDYLNSRTRNVSVGMFGVSEEDKPLFSTHKGNGFNANGMSKHFEAMSKKVGVKFTSHSGRRSICTRLVHEGTNMFDVQALMRHKDISTTMLYYQKDEVRLGSIMESL